MIRGPVAPSVPLFLPPSRSRRTLTADPSTARVEVVGQGRELRLASPPLYWAAPAVGSGLKLLTASVGCYSSQGFRARLPFPSTS